MSLVRRAARAARRVGGRLLLPLQVPVQPWCRDFGFTRGTPVDRYYIERFLGEHAADVQGRVLEVADDGYSRRFGGARVLQQDVLHVRPEPGATIAGDLANGPVLPRESFDCLIVTQTLHLIFDMKAALAELHAALRPGGVLLLTVPGITPVDQGEWRDGWYWSLTEHAARRLLSGPFDPKKCAVRSFGNHYAASAFLRGAALEETSRRKLDAADPAFPVIVAARAVR
jgi:SAM-dependent methyltransferase